MKSPVDTKARLSIFQISPGLTGWRCTSTGGVWIDGSVYWQWFRTKNDTDLDAGTEGPPARADDTQGLLISPRTGRFMRAYRIGSEFDFTVHHDSSEGTGGGGFWFDRGEFETLAAAGMHNKLHLIFDEDWQKRLRKEETDRAYQSHVRRVLGDDLDRAEVVRSWLQEHPNRSAILAFISDEQV